MDKPLEDAGNVASWLSRDVRGNRQMSLEHALSEFVQPDSTLYIATDARAAVRGLARRFGNSGASLTVICLRAGAGHVGELLHARLVKKLVAASFGIQFPSFQPCPLVQRSHLAGETQFECWSLFSLVQRLMAGAMGIPFFPTRSLSGSAMTFANANYASVSSPFSEESFAVVSALNPEITIAHALAADPFGNAIVLPPFEDDLWSTRAASKGVIVLTENMVSTEFIRKHANLVRIPAANVIAVCHTPYAAHPEGFESGLDLGLPINAYARDIEHYQNYASAARNEATFRAWAKEWIAGIADHAAYVERIKPGSILRASTGPSDNAAELDKAYSRYVPTQSKSRTSVEMMIVVTARAVRDIVISKRYKTMLVGAGNCRTAGALAYFLLKKMDYAVTLVEGTGRIGYEPVPVPNANRLTATMLTGTVDAYGTLVGGREAQCLALLGSGEIDAFGNMNSTYSNGQFLVGSGGSNDAVSLAAETIVMMRQNAKRMVPKAEYVTCSGTRVSHLVSDQGVFGKSPDGLFTLRQYFSSPDIQAADAAISAIQGKCGWQVKADDGIKPTPEPTEEELSILRWLTGSQTR